MISWKICSSWRRNCFHWQQLTVVWESGRSWFPLARKSVTLVNIWSFLENCFSLISVTVSIRRENLWTKEMSFHQPENPFSLARMKKTFLLYEKITGRSLWNMKGKKWFPLARKSQLSVAFSKNKLFFWKLLTPNSNDSFY